MADTIVDAWIVGQHELPANVPRRVVGSVVVVHVTATHDEWTGMSIAEFDEDFEWLPEPTERLIVVGDRGRVELRKGAGRRLVKAARCTAPGRATTHESCRNHAPSPCDRDGSVADDIRCGGTP